MNENMRISDADRDHVVERLREHYADGRLTSEELDERITTTLNAKTYGDLRGVMADLPEPDPVGAPGTRGALGALGTPGAGPFGSQGWESQPWSTGGRPMMAYRRGPRILPLVLIAFAVTLLLPGGGLVFVGILKIILAFWLVMCIMGVFAAARFRRHVRRHMQSQTGDFWHHHEWRR
jgi:Domain of unknown function (DUF1707)